MSWKGNPAHFDEEEKQEITFAWWMFISLGPKVFSEIQPKFQLPLYDKRGAKTEAAHSLCSHSLSHSLFLSSPSHLPLRSQRRWVLASPLRRCAVDFPSSSWICSSSSSVLLHLIVEPLSDIVVILGLLILIPIDLQTSSSCFCCTTCWCWSSSSSHWSSFAIRSILLKMQMGIRVFSWVFRSKFLHFFRD